MTTTPLVQAALKQRFAAPEWALMFEVANGTGAHIRRYADAVAMNLYPSRGLELHGVEIKVSRSDWQRELKNPEKAETIFRYCDRWWIVAPAGIVAKAELPPTWGLLEFNGGKLTQAVAAPTLQPEPLTRHFIAAMMRRSSEADHALVDAMVARNLAALRERDKEHTDREIERRTRDAEKKLEKVRQIEAAAGISLTDWDATPELGLAIKAIRAAGLSKTWGGLQSLVDGLKRHADGVQAQIDAFVQSVPTEKETA